MRELCVSESSVSVQKLVTSVVRHGFIIFEVKRLNGYLRLSLGVTAELSILQHCARFNWALRGMHYLSKMYKKE